MKTGEDNSPDLLVWCPNRGFSACSDVMYTCLSDPMPTHGRDFPTDENFFWTPKDHEEGDLDSARGTLNVANITSGCSNAS